MSKPDMAYWERLSAQEFIYESGCWKSCGSFCCRWDHPDIKFNIMPRGGTLFYMEEEYGYMSAYKKVTEIEPYSMSIDYDGSKPLKLLYKHCASCDSNCNILFSRSLFCRLYPFLPVFDISGNLLDVKYISVFDVTLAMVGGSTPCTVIKNKEKYFDLWSRDPKLLDLLREPYTLFHLIAANIIHVNYTEVMKDKIDQMMKDPSKFWQRWEMEYLTGKLVNKQTIKQEIAVLYRRMTEKYGDFI